MKTTKIITIVLGIFFFLGCSNDDELTGGVQNLESFVRFNFLVNSNNDPLEFPAKSGSAIPLSNYVKNSIKTLKIPVTLSIPKLSGTVTVDYSLTSDLDPERYEISPASLSFSGNQLTDTIYVDFDQRWEPGDILEFKLTGVSDENIKIGNLNTTNPNDVFTVQLEETTTTYKFSSNRIELEGNIGEEKEFTVEFPNGYFPSEIDEDEIFEILEGFQFDLERIEENANSIVYKIILREDIKEDDVTFQSVITLKENALYSPVGDFRLQIIKPILSDRDKTLNTAANFYNLSDAFHRTFGEHWLDHNNDGVCEWRSYFAFTYPIEVDADDENAVLGNDNGTEDPSDDIYYHAFQIGFTSPLANRTTNSFNFARLFDNESSNADVSPGLNVSPALEFYPEGGTSATGGTVLVVPQFITLSSREGTAYSLALSGSGEYRETEPGLFEIELELNITSDELFGGTVTSQYFIYNNNSYEDPEPLTGSCLELTTL